MYHYVVAPPPPCLKDGVFFSSLEGGQCTHHGEGESCIQEVVLRLHPDKNMNNAAKQPKPPNSLKG